MLELFLDNAGRKLQVLAKVVMTLTLLATVALLAVAIFVSEAVTIGLVGAVVTLLGGWSSALVLQAIGDAAEGASGSYGYVASRLEDKAAGPVRGSKQPEWRCSCGTLNKASSGTCSTCGRAKQRKCPACGKELSATDDVCPHCGTRW